MKVLELLLSALISSWQFFKEAALAPRIEFALLKTKDDTSFFWEEFNLRPKELSMIELGKSLFFNARWNEALFIMDCAERLALNHDQHSY